VNGMLVAWCHGLTVMRVQVVFAGHTYKARFWVSHTWYCHEPKGGMVMVCSSDGAPHVAH